MKTPMQQMLELLEELLDSKPTRADRTRFETAISKAKELIQDEKKVIMNAYWNGGRYLNSDDYYKETFNTK
ncbi:hypothetical protein EB169_10990 [archaeon]|nr:hypothetical protein [archaeon]